MLFEWDGSHDWLDSMSFVLAGGKDEGPTFGSLVWWWGCRPHAAGRGNGYRFSKLERYLSLLPTRQDLIFGSLTLCWFIVWILSCGYDLVSERPAELIPFKKIVCVSVTEVLSWRMLNVFVVWCHWWLCIFSKILGEPVLDFRKMFLMIIILVWKTVAFI